MPNIEKSELASLLSRLLRFKQFGGRDNDRYEQRTEDGWSRSCEVIAVISTELEDTHRPRDGCQCFGPFRTQIMLACHVSPATRVQDPTDVGEETVKWGNE